MGSRRRCHLWPIEKDANIKAQSNKPGTSSLPGASEGLPSKKSRRSTLPTMVPGKAMFGLPQKRKMLLNGELEAITQARGYTCANAVVEGSQQVADLPAPGRPINPKWRPKTVSSGPQQDRRYRRREQCVNRNCSYQPSCGWPEAATMIHQCFDGFQATIELLSPRWDGCVS
jgi:hypothetical protein